MKRLLVVLLAFLVSAFLFTGGAIARTYITSFPLAERPISEGGNWLNGKSVGLDWSDVSTNRGLAIGTQIGSGAAYKDATAILTGPWKPDQWAQATVYTVNQDDSYYQEVELRLRSSVSAYSNTGYEINFRCSKTSNAYMEIVRWNGALGSFTYIARYSGAQYGVANGDTVKAGIVGNVITVYINDVKKGMAVDTTYATGSPGIGFYLQGGAATNEDYGFTSFVASDEFP